MLKIGIVGAENSHCAKIGRLCNVEKKVPARVVAIWGEKPSFAKAAAEAAQVPEIVKDWRQMLGKVDGIMIDHRHPKYHAEVATFFIQNGVPCFVDKPFTHTLAAGRRLCDLARKKKAPLTTFSSLPLHKSFQDFKRAASKLGKICNLTTMGPVELNSKYGGVFFYGIHQVDAIIELLGTKVDKVSLQRNGKNGIAVITYKDGPIVAMHCISEGPSGWHWSATGERETLDWPHQGDPNAHLTGLKRFCRMFRTREEPATRERMLAPIAVLEAMQKSLACGKPVKVGRLS